MNKKELIREIAAKTEMTQKDVAKVVEGIQETITTTLQEGDNVSLIGFGKFEVRTRAARVGINPATGDKLELPSLKSPAFKPSKTFKDIIKGS